jgi:hypothetical protein
MPKPFTHIVVKYPSTDTDLLYRAADGMAMGCRIGTRVLSGPDPNPAKMDVRNFLDKTFAEMYMRTLCERDQQALLGAGYGFSIDERYGESALVSAGARN